MLKPPKREYERIPKYKPEWVEGVISKIESDPHKERSFKGEKKTDHCIRFVFTIQGCEFEHKSRWMTFTYAEKSSLYQKYVKELVEGAYPNMDFAIDELIGMDVKTMWTQDGQYDELEMIVPAVGKLKPSVQPEERND